MAELKVALKEAKNSIKDKDYEAAMIHCKDALKIDRKNYQALVMFGRVCQELRRYMDSKKSLLLATQIDSENPLAWQGLSMLHEKDQSIFTKEEEIEILTQLQTLFKEEDKLDRIYRRLAAVYQRFDCVLDAVNVLEALAEKLDDKNLKLEVHKSIIQLLDSVSNPSSQMQQKLEETYEKILNDSFLGENESNYEAYLRLLYKMKQFDKLIAKAKIMASIFPTVYPLEWMARAYVESDKIFGGERIENLDEDMVDCLSKLLSRYSDSPWGNLSKGLMLIKENKNEDAKIHLRKGCELLKNNIDAWLMLLDCQISLNDFSGVELTCGQIMRLLESNQKFVFPSSKRFASKESLHHFLLLTQSSALFHLGHVNHLRQAILLLQQIPNRDVESNIMLVKILIKVGKSEEASVILDKMMKDEGNSPLIQQLFAYVARSKGDMDTAKSIYEELLEESPSNAEILFELGRINFEEKAYQKALIYLLKAAKHNPKLSCAFLYLGHYYRVQGNLEKARKCYEKALNLNPINEEAGASLSDVYRYLEEHELNLALLLQVTSESRSGWAWLRLGLHYLSLKNNDEAVKALQFAVELNPEDRVCYECLGDAYLARGAYTAALKVFEKAVELSGEKALYPRCQIARIHHSIGEFLYSVSEYEKVLAESPPYAVNIVALVGLAEVLLTRARKHKENQFLSSLKHDCLYAIRCLTRAACENASHLTVWKLLGDACTLQVSMPPSLSKFLVPKRLLDSSVSDLSLMQEINKEEILLLGGRCYGVGLHITKDKANLWHDLGVNIFYQGWSQTKLSKGTNTVNEEENDIENESIQSTLQRALTAVKKSLIIDASVANAWNSLGIIAFFKGELDLAQDAFIRSLTLSPNCDGWTNLGALYLVKKDIHLAHEAFSQAQAFDPGYISCWVGQAMVAASVGHYEAFDLFRHTTVLGIHPESCLGHASNVLKLACGMSEGNDYQHYQKLDTFIPGVQDCLTFYTRDKEMDALGQNMFGLTLEMMGLHRSASIAFAKAVEACDQRVPLSKEIHDGILSNYGRILTTLNKYEEAVKYYSQLKEPDFFSQCGLALTRLKAGEFDEAYQKYTEALVWLAPDDVQKSHVLVALAFLQYKFNNIEQVKTLLFQSSSVQGLLALTALGLIEGDSTLTSAALAELEPYVDSKDYCHPVAFLQAAKTTKEGNFHEAKLILSKAIHRHPHIAPLWRSLSQHLLRMDACHSSNSRIHIAEGANAAASAAQSLTQADGCKDNIYLDVVMKAMAYLKASFQPAVPETKKKKKAKIIIVKPEKNTTKLSQIEAQRAVLMCPSKPETWAVLIATIGTNTKTVKLAEKWKADAKPELKSWLENFESTAKISLT